MKIRLHEIELGHGHGQNSTLFYQSVFGLTPKLQQQGLTILDAGLPSFDFNVSSHLPAGVAVFSFLTDDLAEVQQRLGEAGIAYEGPRPSHLGMTAIQFRDPAGHLVRVNTPGEDSPQWLNESFA